MGSAGLGWADTTRLGSEKVTGLAPGSRAAALTSQRTRCLVSHVVRHGSTTSHVPAGETTRTETSSQFESHGSVSSSGNW